MPANAAPRNASVSGDMAGTAAPAVITVFAVAESFAGFGSLVLNVFTVAVLLIVPDAPGTTATTSVNVAESPAMREVMLQETVPFAPTAGVVHEKDGPVFCANETNLVWGGRVSLRKMPKARAFGEPPTIAAPGPAFDTAITYVRFVPAIAVGGPLLVTERSAGGGPAALAAETAIVPTTKAQATTVERSFIEPSFITV
jgi:hypothetical protein